MKKSVIAIVFLLGLVIGYQLCAFLYQDACLDLGGGTQPDNYPICVIEVPTRIN